MRRFVAFAVLSMLPAASVTSARGLPRLRVSANGRFLERANGRPFFYLGDTAWELFHRLTREEADFYLANRAAKGFTAIQAVVLAEFDGLGVPNAYGATPLVANDPTRPNEAYFRHVDYVVRSAERLGLYIAMLPTWGDKWNKKWGVGPEIFTPENAEAFGEFFGKRYRNSAIIWVLGGDRSPENDRHRAIVRALARGLERGDGGAHLMTYHPMGGDSSATFFHDDGWLDFNMIQSGHAARDIPNYEAIARNYARSPAKPTIDGEPRYEDHPINWDPKNGWFDAYDVRQAAYWSMLAGVVRSHLRQSRHLAVLAAGARGDLVGADAVAKGDRSARRVPGRIHAAALRISRLHEARPRSKRDRRRSRRRRRSRDVGERDRRQLRLRLSPDRANDTDSARRPRRSPREGDMVRSKDGKGLGDRNVRHPQSEGIHTAVVWQGQ